jgi:hypothetical protein
MTEVAAVRFLRMPMARTKEEKVELHPAYSWDCPECGSEQFARGIVFEPSAEDERLMRETNGVPPGEIGDWVSMPTRVRCIFCRCEFETVHIREDEF